MHTITITFKDGTVLNALSASKSQEHFQAANRQTVEFKFDKDAATFEQLQTLFKGHAAEDFVVHELITDDETGETISDNTTEYVDFTLLVKLIYHNDRVPVDPEPDPSANDGEDPEPTPTVMVALYTVKMAQVSNLEKIQKLQTAMVEENMNALIELAEIIG
ncbi:MAG: hypothetical protein J6Y02_24260 [Pseudobutyrivibrio sp.]|nr:hypothetical protein [Pseudobutyrivibrio sp.]